MGKQKGEERITNDDGTESKVQYYDDKIVVHDSGGGHVTDWFSNPGIHVTDENGNQHWESKKPE